MTILLIVVAATLTVGACASAGIVFDWQPRNRPLQWLLGAGFFGSMAILFVVAAWLWLALTAWFSEPGGILP